jgi:hypothetical protein
MGRLVCGLGKKTDWSMRVLFGSKKIQAERRKKKKLLIFEYLLVLDLDEGAAWSHPGV